MDRGSNKSVIEGEYLKYNEVHPDIFKPERIDLLQKNTSISFNDLDAPKTIYNTIYRNNDTSPNPTSGHFTIQESDTKIKIEMSVKQDDRLTDYFVLIILSNGSQIYRQTFEEFKNPQDIEIELDPVNQCQYYLFDVTKEINLPAGYYTFQLERAPHHYHYEGECRISHTENTLTLTGNSSLKPEIYYQYDTKGNVIESKPAGSNVPTAYLWGYNYQYPVAKIENATYEQVTTALNGQTVVDRIADADSPSNADSIAIHNLRTNLPDAMVTTYMYKQLVGLQTIIDPRGIKTTYHYDPFGRLEAIKDENSYTIENYKYHYKN
ncbi:hypothetical protein FACS189440_18710 [Bacteroidia bacterium]|nr:hypothetical protein FACS189440_18710 [Bacteroidia bacterium]